MVWFVFVCVVCCVRVVCLMSLCGLIVTHCVKLYGLFGLFCVRVWFVCLCVAYVLGCCVYGLLCDEVCCSMCPFVFVLLFNVFVRFVCDSLCDVVWSLVLLFGVLCACVSLYCLNVYGCIDCELLCCCGVCVFCVLFCVFFFERVSAV